MNHAENIHASNSFEFLQAQTPDMCQWHFDSNWPISKSNYIFKKSADEFNQNVWILKQVWITGATNYRGFLTVSTIIISKGSETKRLLGGNEAKWN